MSKKKIAEAAVEQIEFYFSKANYRRDVELRSLADKEGYISLPHIFNNFFSMKQFQKHINIKDLYNALKDSSLVELNDDYFIKRMV